MKSLLIALLCATPAWCGTLFSGQLDTSGIAGGSYYLDFQFLDGSGNGDANNMVTAGNFAFGIGGASAGTDCLDGISSCTNGGILSSGSLSVVLTDSGFFNEVLFPFTAGDMLSFDMTLTELADAGSPPDEFSLYLLDATQFPLMTADAVASAFTLVDIAGNPIHVADFQLFQFDPGGPLNGATFSVTESMTTSATPEPGTVFLVLAAFSGYIVGSGLRLRKVAGR